MIIKKQTPEEKRRKKSEYSKKRYDSDPNWRRRLKEATIRWRRERAKAFKEKGLCSYCGGDREDKNFLMCEKCRKMKLEDYNRLVANRKKKKVCTGCANEREDEGYLFCDKCRKKARIKSQKKKIK